MKKQEDGVSTVLLLCNRIIEWQWAYNGGGIMLTAKQERFCQNLEVKKMSQREAYIDAYPSSKKWKPASIDEVACRLANSVKIMSRRKELRNEVKDDIRQEAKWTRTNAYNALVSLIEKAQRDIDAKQELTAAIVSAIINATKELNNIYAVGEDTDGKGVLEDILSAVRGVDND